MGHWTQARRKGARAKVRVFVTTVETEGVDDALEQAALRFLDCVKGPIRSSGKAMLSESTISRTTIFGGSRTRREECRDDYRAARINLMFKTTVSALGGEENAAFLRPRLRESL